MPSFEPHSLPCFLSLCSRHEHLKVVPAAGWGPGFPGRVIDQPSDFQTFYLFTSELIGLSGYGYFQISFPRVARTYHRSGR